MGVSAMTDRAEPATTDNQDEAVTERQLISETFTDPICEATCTLHVAPWLDFWLAAKVEHPGCTHLADVSADLDCFYCQTCRWNGRITGAWVFDLWADAQPPANSKDGAR